MQRALVLSLLAGSASAVSINKGNLKGSMRPDLVAHTLEKVESEWKSQAAMFAECNAAQGSDFESDCSAAPKAFHKSCATVVSAVVKASSGDRAIVNEYMKDICSEAVLTGWKKTTCQGLSTLVYNSMTADDYGNRVEMNADAPCTKFWSQFQAEEKARVEKEKAEQEAQDKKEAEEQAALDKKAAEEKKAEDEALKAQQAEEAKLSAAEGAKQKAEEADTKLEEQKAAAVIDDSVAKPAADAAAATPAPVAAAPVVAAVAAVPEDVKVAEPVKINATVVAANATNATKVNATTVKA